MKKQTERVLTLADGTVWKGEAFGYGTTASGEVVFNTGMTGYPETLTDPSYSGQILIETFPMIGNYGVPNDARVDALSKHFESDTIHIRGLIIARLASEYSHHEATRSLDAWLKEHKIPGITGIDTRALTKHLRTHGAMLGIIADSTQGVKNIEDPNAANLIAAVSPIQKKIYTPKHGKPKKRVVLVDCGAKNNIIRSLLERNIEVVRVPWDFDFLDEHYDGILLSNGPGDPTQAHATVEHVRSALKDDRPIFGICLGNQILALAAGATTYKLPFGHRSHNQPCTNVDTGRCYITSQNHGYAVEAKTLPKGWREWFVNANDGTNEGIRHERKPFFSVQFHPEASAGPTDTAFLFDEFIAQL
ncbi:MAG: carbamoyl-phosphate synthase (glutamine-hydrolyzing) small subunit [Candidatus Parcubacteria bacterium]|jgi:carbamoyl-phosphate synthase small subunit